MKSNDGPPGEMPGFLKFCSVAILVLVVIMALGPEKRQPRTGLGWEFDPLAISQSPHLSALLGSGHRSAVKSKPFDGEFALD
jgi:hypothetical protein